MNESKQVLTEAGRGSVPLTLAAAVLVVLLAVGALLWPRGGDSNHPHVLLVCDTSGNQSRQTRVYASLREYLVSLETGALDLVVTPTVTEFMVRLAEQPDFVLAPDGLALQAPPTQYLPLVAGRRAAPRNLRPRGVLVSRRAAAGEPEPWRTQPQATVFGDSLSLTAVGVLRGSGANRWQRNRSCGPDPYDHGPVLHALRLGGFSHALVRQWDADRFFAEGLLNHDQFVVREVVAPVPDAVLLVSRNLPRHLRLRCGEGLSALGRQQDEEAPLARDLRLALADLHLAGFNLLLEPDFELVRKNFARDWLPTVD